MTADVPVITIFGGNLVYPPHFNGLFHFNGGRREGRPRLRRSEGRWKVVAEGRWKVVAGSSHAPLAVTGWEWGQGQRMCCFTPPCRRGPEVEGGGWDLADGRHSHAPAAPGGGPRAVYVLWEPGLTNGLEEYLMACQSIRNAKDITIVRSGTS